jgi:hypothetical protein
VLLEFNPMVLLAEAIDGLAKYLFGVDLKAAGQKMLQSLIDGIKSLLPDFQAMLQPIRDAVSWVDRQWTRAKGVAKSVVDAGGQVVDTVGRGATTVIDRAAGGVQQIAGQVGVSISIANLPPGSRVETQQSGAVQSGADVGYSMPAAN